MKIVIIAASLALGARGCGGPKEEKDDDVRKVGVDSCVETFYQELGDDDLAFFDKEKLDKLVKDYCWCSVDALMEEDIPPDEMKSLEEEELMEIIEDCYDEFEEKIPTAMKE